MLYYLFIKSLTQTRNPSKIGLAEWEKYVILYHEIGFFVSGSRNFPNPC